MRQTKRIFAPTTGVSDWRKRLADPDRHWKRERSAFELAVSWEAVVRTERGLPVCIADLLDQQSDLCGATLLFAMPEHQVPLNGLGKASQTDVWALLRVPDKGYISLAVEGKAGEPFDKSVSKWMQVTLEAPDAGDAYWSPHAPDFSAYNRKIRLKDILDTLDLNINDVRTLRYQLLHRAASALKEADRCGASQAVMIVQSFDGEATGFDDFQDFCQKLSCIAQRNSLVSAGVRKGIPFYLGWSDCPLADDKMVADAVA